MMVNNFDADYSVSGNSINSCEDILNVFRQIEKLREALIIQTALGITAIMKISTLHTKPAELHQTRVIALCAVPYESFACYSHCLPSHQQHARCGQPSTISTSSCCTESGLMIKIQFTEILVYCLSSPITNIIALSSFHKSETTMKINSILHTTAFPYCYHHGLFTSKNTAYHNGPIRSCLSA